jgi:putative PIN family toxin of toxin-antitoxin system
MRVLLDTNVVISHLISPRKKGNLHILFQSLFKGRFTLLLPEALLDEVVVTVSQKPQLMERIPVKSLQELVGLFQEIGEPVKRISSAIPSISRDPKDDYLLAYAVVGQADYLVTGDKDLLALKKVAGVTIITPADFVELL